MAHHELDPDRVHHVWDRDLEPVLTVASGDTVSCALRMAGHGQLEEDSTAADVTWDFDTLYHLAGPVAVEGARPGDTLEVEVVALEPGPWGWTGVIPELGLLPDEFPEAVLRTFDLRGTDAIALAPGVRVPIVPFLGTMGVPEDVPGQLSPFPPHGGGGNVDNRHLGVGARLLLPAALPGARFSFGDPHAAQGDGEVCVSALECAMDATLRLTVHRRATRVPSYVIPPAPPGAARLASAGWHGTMGLGGDLHEGARTAVFAMLDWLEAERGLSRTDAYLLCSLAGDLRIHEIVDAGVWNVGFQLPLAVFTDG
jgi:acetamidase/formamidase